MAVAVVNSKETTTATGSLTITSATLGHLLVVFVSTAAYTSPISMSDNISGSTGWTTHPTIATYGASNQHSVQVAYKVAVGGETTLTATGGTLKGVLAFELSGTGASLDVVTANSGQSTATPTSGSFTTTKVDAILCGIGINGLTGGNSGWSGTGPMTNVSTATGAFGGGYYVPGTTVTGASFTFTSSTSNLCAALTVGVAPVSSNTAGVIWVI